MDRDFHKTLFYPFERGLLDLPAGGTSALIIGADRAAALPRGWAAQTTWVQGFRPDFLALRDSGADVTPEIDGSGYDMTLVLCGRHRGQNEAWISEALARTRGHGILVVAGGKTDGIESLRRRAGQHVPIENALSKYHGSVFWLRRPSSLTSHFAETRPAVKSGEVEGFATAPGMFSHKHIDTGSKLLAESLPPGLTGAAADFGAGWGYLSVELLRKSPGISTLDLFEADHASLEAAKKNLAPHAGRTGLNFSWIDLLCETVGRKYDQIIMNPPFHTGRAAEPDIGAGMIAIAAKALKPGGRLFMVANRNLPYEQVIRASFSQYREVRCEAGYKVIHAVH